ncbi:MAG: glycosyltransferase family 4 protein, partial [Jatrophihabitantaceae bacterium]
PGLAGRATNLLRGKVRDLRAGNLRRTVSWMPIDERVEMVYVARLDERTALPPADLRIGTYWRTSEFLAERPADGVASMQLIQAYEIWAGPSERVQATWRLPMHTVVVSESLYRLGLELGVPEQRLHLAANGIDHEVFQVRTPVAGRAPCVSLLAHDAPVKGLAEAVAACRIVHQARPEVRFLAFGGAPRPAMLPDFIEYLRRPLGADLAERVYNRSSVFLCASQSEGFGFPSLEAMACGAALVSTRNGGVDDFAVDGESALLADVGDSAGLAEAILSLVADEPTRVRLAERGVQAAGRFNWTDSSDAFERAVQAALTLPVR